MNEITGVKSVEFKIIAKGYGVVNWNGSTTLTGDNGKNLDNHMLPKLRGFSSYSGKVKEDTGYKHRKNVHDIDFKLNPLYISQNCIRHHLFKDQNYDLHFADKKNLLPILASVMGLLRGYVIPSTQNKRTSPLMIFDLVDQLGNGNYEQFSTDMPNEKIKGENGEEDTYKRSSSTIYSKTTFGETEYVGYGSICIENLEFISLDPEFDNCAMFVKTDQKKAIEDYMNAFLASLNKSKELSPKATFHTNYVRLGTSVKEKGQVGILLNDDAIEVLVSEMLRRITNLGIKQAKGYMYVDNVIVDYNDSEKSMRIRRDESSISEFREGPYATYFEGK